MVGPVAEKSNATPSPEREDDAKAEKIDETDAVGSRLETVGSV